MQGVCNTPVGATLAHHALTMSSKASAATLFEAVLGLKFRRAFSIRERIATAVLNSSNCGEVVVYADGHTEVEVYIDLNSRSGRPFDHICFEVDDRERVAQLAKDHGLEVLPADRDTSETVFVRDLDGNLYEVWERGTHSANSCDEHSAAPTNSVQREKSQCHSDEQSRGVQSDFADMNGLRQSPEKRLPPLALLGPKGLPCLAKRLLDLVISLPAVAILSPLLLLIAVVTKLDSKGSVFFVQDRRGLGYIPFRVIKFRTMAPGSAAPQKPCEMLPDDPRITRIGALLRRTSLDELPQLFNVIQGTMSLVGPRPLPNWEAEPSLERHGERYAVKPGITGLSQVTGRNSCDFYARLDLDVEYVRRWSLALDLAILFRTPLALFRVREVYNAKATDSRHIR